MCMQKGDNNQREDPRLKDLAARNDTFWRLSSLKMLQLGGLTDSLKGRQ